MRLEYVQAKNRPATKMRYRDARGSNAERFRVEREIRGTDAKCEEIFMQLYMSWDESGVYRKEKFSQVYNRD